MINSEQHRDPRRVMRGVFKGLRKRFEQIPGIGGLCLWATVGEQAQAEQEAVFAEVSREGRECLTLIDIALVDGVATPRELAPVVRRLREMEQELEECRVIKGF